VRVTFEIVRYQTMTFLSENSGKELELTFSCRFEKSGLGPEVETDIPLSIEKSGSGPRVEAAVYSS
jgi:hypothetical protein